MSEKENSVKRRQTTKRFTVTGCYENARVYGEDQISIDDGDTCAVNVGATHQDGDLVLIECSEFCASEQTTPHYHALYYCLCTGKKYKFRLSRYNRLHAARGGKLCVEGDERIIVGPVVKVIKKGKTPTGKTTDLTAGFDWSYFGIHRGDTLMVKHTQDVKIGQLILEKDEQAASGISFSRVSNIQGDTLTTAGDVDLQTSARGSIHRSRVIGYVVEIKHEDCRVAKIKALRERLERLGKEDDQIIRCSERFRIETEIYNLEHPLAEEETSEEWPEVIGEGGA
jgi:hypothetical protein